MMMPGAFQLQLLLPASYPGYSRVKYVKLKQASVKKYIVPGEGAGS